MQICSTRGFASKQSIQNLLPLYVICPLILSCRKIQVEMAAFGLDRRPAGSKTSHSTRKNQVAVDRKLVNQTGRTLHRGGY